MKKKIVKEKKPASLKSSQKMGNDAWQRMMLIGQGAMDIATKYRLIKEKEEQAKQAEKEAKKAAKKKAVKKKSAKKVTTVKSK
jgi:isoaspartyl peptidase/L-asparaginase-like protein (Ntn-hydrolase superfamily)